ncbi:MAG: potassium transporter TrkA, partial [Actinomyces sp.]
VFEASDELLLLVPDADAAELEDLRQRVASPISEDSEDEDSEE